MKARPIKKRNEITWYSKLAALIVFASVFLLGILCGSQIGNFGFGQLTDTYYGSFNAAAVNLAHANAITLPSKDLSNVTITKKSTSYVIQNKNSFALTACTFTMPNRMSNKINIKSGQKYTLDKTDFPLSNVDQYFGEDFDQVSYFYMSCTQGGTALQAN